MSERACGSCSLCCKLLRIEELQKLPGDWCVHVLRGKGCGIYESRPAPCRSFLCYWMLQPKLDDAWRPDRCGFLLRDGSYTALPGRHTAFRHQCRP